MIVPSRHRPLIPDAWSETVVRAAIEQIAADAIAHFDPDRFWPGHPSGEGENDGDPSFYKGGSYHITNRGLQIDLDAIPHPLYEELFLALLDSSETKGWHLAVELES